MRTRPPGAARGRSAAARGSARDRAIDDRTRVLAGIVVGDDHFIADAAGLLAHQRVDHQLEIGRAIVRGDDDRETRVSRSWGFLAILP